MKPEFLSIDRRHCYIASRDPVNHSFDIEKIVEGTPGGATARAEAIREARGAGAEEWQGKIVKGRAKRERDKESHSLTVCVVKVIAEQEGILNRFWYLWWIVAKPVARSPLT